MEKNHLKKNDSSISLGKLESPLRNLGIESGNPITSEISSTDFSVCDFSINKNLILDCCKEEAINRAEYEERFKVYTKTRKDKTIDVIPEFYQSLIDHKELNIDEGKIFTELDSLDGYDKVKYKARGKVDVKLLFGIIKSEEHRGISLQKLAKYFGVSKNTIHRILKDDFGFKNTRIKPKMQILEKEDICQSINKYIDWFKENSKNVFKIVYFDESMFYLKSSKATCWTKSGKTIYEDVENINAFLTLSFAVTFDGEIVFSFDENKNDTETMKKFIHKNKENLFSIASKYKNGESDKRDFYLDNYKVHYSNEVKKLLTNFGFNLVYGPQYKPKANVVEFLFGIIKNKISRIVYKSL